MPTAPPKKKKKRVVNALCDVDSYGALRVICCNETMLERTLFRLATKQMQNETTKHIFLVDTNIYLSLASSSLAELLPECTDALSSPL